MANILFNAFYLLILERYTISFSRLLKEAVNVQEANIQSFSI
jgi:hypothetical protein